MISLTINDKIIEVEEGLTILEAAESAGIKIPTMCSHKALSPYGACRICLVEISQDGRPSTIQASCTYPALPGLIIKTDSERVIKTRKIMIELLWSRCPDSEDIINLAKELGVEKTRIKPALCSKGIGTGSFLLTSWSLIFPVGQIKSQAPQV